MVQKKFDNQVIDIQIFWRNFGRSDKLFLVTHCHHGGST